MVLYYKPFVVCTYQLVTEQSFVPFDVVLLALSPILIFVTVPLLSVFLVPFAELVFFVALILAAAVISFVSLVLPAAFLVLCIFSEPNVVLLLLRNINITTYCCDANNTLACN